MVAGADTLIADRLHPRDERVEGMCPGIAVRANPDFEILRLVRSKREPSHQPNGRVHPPSLHHGNGRADSRVPPLDEPAPLVALEQYDRRMREAGWGGGALRVGKKNPVPGTLLHVPDPVARTPHQPMLLDVAPRKDHPDFLDGFRCFRRHAKHQVALSRFHPPVDIQPAPVVRAAGYPDKAIR